MNFDLDSICIAFLSTYVLQAAKKAQALAFVNPTTVRALSLIVAALTAAGIGWSYAADGGVLTITGLTAEGCTRFLWTVAKQFLLQDVAYRAAFQVRKPTLTLP